MSEYLHTLVDPLVAHPCLDTSIMIRRLVKSYQKTLKMCSKNCCEKIVLHLVIIRPCLIARLMFDMSLT
jgi:hypothetical protein